MQNGFYKPNFNSFVLYRLLKTTVTLFILSLIAAAVIYGFTDLTNILLYLLLVLLFTILISLYSILRYIRWKKEFYYLEDSKIIQVSGSLFSSSKTQLPAEKVTSVRHSIPYIEDSLFSTSYIFIDSAGSVSSSILISSIKNGEKFIAEVRDVIKSVGVSIDETELISTQKPSKIGAFLDMIKSVWGFLFAILFGLIIQSGGSAFELILEFASEALLLIIGGLLILCVLFLIKAFLKYQDIVHTQYSIYKEVITYKNGFLNKNYAFLPLQNLTDTEVSQGFLERITGVENILLSTKGQSHFITFQYLKDGYQFEKIIKEVIRNEHIKSRENLEDEGIASHTSTEEQKDLSQEKSTSQQDINSTQVQSSFAYTIKPNLPRNLMKIFFSLFIIIPFTIGAIFSPPIFIIANIAVLGTFISPLIRILFTKYHITTNSVVEDYNLLNRKVTEFSFPKITSIIVKEGILDKLFNTITIQFFSQGSSSSLHFMHVKKDKLDLNNLTNKIGFDNSITAKTTYKPNFSVSQFFIYSYQNLLSFFFVFVVTVLVFIFRDLLEEKWNISLDFINDDPNIFFIILFASLILIFLITNIPSLIIDIIQSKTGLLQEYKNSYHYVVGRLRKREHYAKKYFIKHTESVTLPFTTDGSLKINITGRHSGGDDNNQDKKSLFNTPDINIKYLKQVRAVQDKIDYSLLDNKPIQIHSSYNSSQFKPNLLNYILPYSLSFIFLIPIVYFPVYALKSSKIYYDINIINIFRYSGILFKERVSILKQNIDYTESNIGLWNKLLSTGNILIYTESGQGVEMQIYGVKEHNEIKRLLE